MTDIWVPKKDVFCPLCDERMTIKKVRTPTGVILNLYFCAIDKVGIWEGDPAFNKWRDTDKTILCPECKTPLKWFLRYMDGYMKAICPACGTKLEKDSDCGINSQGGIELDDFEENQPKETRIEVPVDKLNLTADQKKIIKAKLKNKREKDNG